MVRLYRSPSPGKRRFIENQSDISAAKSPICGAGVLGKMARGKSSESHNPIHPNNSSNRKDETQGHTNTVINGSRQIEYVSVFQNSKKGGLFGSPGGGISYESVGGSSTFSAGRRSPESTESSTSGNSSHENDAYAYEEDKQSEKSTPAYALQFEPHVQETTKQQERGIVDDSTNNARQQLRMDRLQAWMEYQAKGGDAPGQSQPGATIDPASPSIMSVQSQMLSIRNRAHLWSANLPAVAEERSFEMEDSSIASGAKSTKEDGEPIKNVRLYSSPERNEMLLAMRQLVLKQQAALSEMAEENRQYRRELQECRQLLTLAKEAYTRQQRQVETFMVEKESADAEVLWLREEVKTLRTEIQGKQEPQTTWISSRSSEEVEERLRKARAETTPERRGKQKTTEDGSSALASPIPSPVVSPVRNWKLKNMLPEINYLSDEAESDDDLVQEFSDLRTSLKQAGISTKDMEEQLHQANTKVANEGRDDSQLSPNMWMARGDHENVGGDELRDSAQSASRSLSPSPVTSRYQQGRAPNQIGQSMYILPGPKVPARASSVGSSSSSFSSASQRSREEVALFKNRLEAIQKKREHRKQIEDNVGSRSGRVRFT